MVGCHASRHQHAGLQVTLNMLKVLLLLLLSFHNLQDGQMSYKQALAYWATGDPGHAETAMRILEGWASGNFEWGLQQENGPLEGKIYMP